MPIPSPSIPSASNAISAVRLNPIQNNRAFYIYSGRIEVDTSEVTMISVNDIGKRDILFCFSIGAEDNSNADSVVKVYSNGSVIFTDKFDTTGTYPSQNHSGLQLILPANTSLEISITGGSATVFWTVAGHGYYLETFK